MKKSLLLFVLSATTAWAGDYYLVHITSILKHRNGTAYDVTVRLHNNGSDTVSCDVTDDNRTRSATLAAYADSEVTFAQLDNPDTPRLSCSR